MASIYNIDRADATQEDHLYVSPVANEEGSWVAFTLFKGKFSPIFVSRKSAADAKAQADAWTLSELSATTSYRYEI